MEQLASGPYTKIEQDFWTDPKVKSLSSDGKFLFLYILTCQHRNIVGCYNLPKGYAQADTKLLLKQFEKAWVELERSGFFRYDYSTETVFICNYLKHNPLDNPNQVISAINMVNRLQDTILFADLAESVRRTNKAFAQPLLELLAQRLAKGFPERFPETSGENSHNSAKPDNRYKITDNIFVVDDNTRAHMREEQKAILDYLDERNSVPERYFGFTPEVGERAKALTNEIYAQFSLKPPTNQDVCNVFQSIRHSIPPPTGSDPQEWRIEFPKDRIDLLLYAFEQATMGGAPGNWNYINGVLRNLHARGITTLGHAEAFDYELSIKKGDA